MKTRKFRYFSADFETTVYSGQKTTEVWAAACVELFSEEVKIFHSRNAKKQNGCLGRPYK